VDQRPGDQHRWRHRPTLTDIGSAQALAFRPGLAHLSGRVATLAAGSQGKTSPGVGIQGSTTARGRRPRVSGARKGQSRSTRTASSGRPTAVLSMSTETVDAARNPLASASGVVKVHPM
jgi:hypothetical protein